MWHGNVLRDIVDQNFAGTVLFPKALRPRDNGTLQFANLFRAHFED